MSVLAQGNTPDLFCFSWQGSLECLVQPTDEGNKLMSDRKGVGPGGWEGWGWGGVVCTWHTSLSLGHMIREVKQGVVKPNYVHSISWSPQTNNKNGNRSDWWFIMFQENSLIATLMDTTPPQKKKIIP